MKRTELLATGSLAAVFAMRLMGLFMIYPGFAIYAHHLQGATPAMIGLALGAYGLTQGLLQIPFGLLSDRIGRKTMITIGLVFFAAGSAVAALSTSITGVLLGRILQGTGAVGSVILALVADLTREEVRTKAMAIIGMTIGLSFAAAIVIGPLLTASIGVSGIFWLTAVMALCGIAIIHGLVPAPARTVRRHDAEAAPALFARMLRDPELLRLDFAIFALHAILTASFLAVPHLIAGSLHLAGSREWMVYLPVLAASVVLMVPAIIAAEKGGRMKEVFMGTIALLGASLIALLAAGDVAAVVVIALIGFFTAFNIMEATLPSLITRIAPAGAKGTATGIYSSLQFLGIFAGGVAGGGASALGGTTGVLTFTVIVALLWLAVAAAMRPPGHYTSYIVRLGMPFDGLAAKLKAVPGVIEAVVAADEGVAYLKIDRAHFDEAAIAQIVAGS